MKNIRAALCAAILLILAPASEASHETFLPNGDIFIPPLADPKQPRFFLSVRQYQNHDDFLGAGVGFGENFGMYRYENHEAGGKYALQLNIQAGLFALFELNDPTYTLISTDFIVGFPVTYRSGPMSWRLNLYHQSSHMGDEFLLRDNVRRKSFLYDAVDLLASYEWQSLRGYLGGEYLVHRIPSKFDPGVGHAGIEYYDNSAAMRSGRFVAGLDLKSFEEHDWEIDASFKAGLEFGKPSPSRRRLRVLLEGFRGFAHWGQFYTERVTYYGLGIHLSE